MSEEHNADELEEAEHTTPVNRRSFVKALGVASGAAVFGASSVGTASAAETKSNPLETNITRQKITGQRASDAVATALNSEVTEDVSVELPSGKSSLKVDDTEVYNITNDKGGRPITLVQFPVSGSDSSFRFAMDQEGSTASYEIDEESGRVAYATSEEQEYTGLLHKVSASDSVTKRSVKALTASKDYQQLKKKLSSSHTFQVKEASVTVVEEQNRSRIVVPVPVKNKQLATLTTGNNMNSEDVLIMADINLDTDTAVVVQGGYWACVALCLSRFRVFYTICRIDCSSCIAVPGPIRCGACAACIGVPIAVCGGGCAIPF